MGLTGLLSLISQIPVYRNVLESINSNERVDLSVIEHAKPYLLGALWRDIKKPMLVICSRPDEAHKLFDQIIGYFDQDAPIHHFPEVELLPYERLTTDSGTVQDRLTVLGSIRGLFKTKTPLVIASSIALMQRTVSPDLMDKISHTIQSGEKILLEATVKKWLQMGYQIQPVVESPGDISRRGGILDIFPTGEAMPVRVELWGDQIETIRRFDPLTQRSGQEIESVLILPAKEILPSFIDQGVIAQKIQALDFPQKASLDIDQIKMDLAGLAEGGSLEQPQFYSGFFNHHTLIDYLVECPDAVLVLNEESEIHEFAGKWVESSANLRDSKQRRGEIPSGFPDPFADWGALFPYLENSSPRVKISRWHAGPEDTSLLMPFAEASSYHGNLEAMKKDIKIRPATPIVIASQHSKRVQKIFSEADIGASEMSSLNTPPANTSVSVVHTSLSGGWQLSVDSKERSDILVTLLSDEEIFGNFKRRNRRRSKTSRRHIVLNELHPGDYVVHTDHGIARFIGTVQGDNSVDFSGGADIQREYLILSYAEDDKLYVPTDHLDRVTQYLGGNEQIPSLTRLGTREWQRVVTKAKESTKKLAEDLLDLYAQRELADGIAYSSDTPWQKEMEDAFPFEETADQIVAIETVKRDMEHSRPMDRLICGDVGYGKTEVAIRAAFKAIMDGRQVAILVPTTILAQQHLDTFSERLSGFPIRIEVLSRFRNQKEQNATIAQMKRGEIDVVIGTHRLLQSDVGFRDLGLVIIDEEHRFGVGHKEKLRSLRNEVDVLTMTATPIPRTLHMAMAGIRDISSIDTPPEERLPVKSYLAESSDELIREAILREIDREGQAFFLHNRVETIYLTAQKLRKLIPEAVVLVAHGQMHEEELSLVMEQFGRGDADVLVCTTIIESGLDIPGVNTIIIDHADRFGLAQLYQLRGRIGRRSQRAYAYLLVSSSGRLTDTAKRRLQTIMASTELGSGFRIAMKDLEIRGAGNILGSEQSGHIHAVGFELYARLLSDAVSDLRASKLREGTNNQISTVDPVIDLDIPSYIPEALIEHMPLRMSFYQRLAGITHFKDLEILGDELRERFGTLPLETSNLLYMAHVRILAKQAYLASVIIRNREIILKLCNPAGGASRALEKSLGHPARVGNQQVHLPFNSSDKTWQDSLVQTLKKMVDFQQKISELAESIVSR